MKREEEILQRAKEEAWYIADTSQTKEEAAIGGYCLGAKYASKHHTVPSVLFLTLEKINVSRINKKFEK